MLKNMLVTIFHLCSPFMFWWNNCWQQPLLDSISDLYRFGRNRVWIRAFRAFIFIAREAQMQNFEAVEQHFCVCWMIMMMMCLYHSNKLFHVVLYCISDLFICMEYLTNSTATVYSYSRHHVITVYLA